MLITSQARIFKLADSRGCPRPGKLAFSKGRFYYDELPYRCVLSERTIC